MEHRCAHWPLPAPGAGDAKGGFKKLSMLHPVSPTRVLVVGLGKREEMDAERARVAAGRIRRAGERWKVSLTERRKKNRSAR